jgi:hypothetical protein
MLTGAQHIRRALVELQPRDSGRVAHLLGVSANTMRRWLHQADLDDGKTPAGPALKPSLRHVQSVLALAVVARTCPAMLAHLGAGGFWEGYTRIEGGPLRMAYEPTREELRYCAGEGVDDETDQADQVEEDEG